MFYTGVGSRKTPPEICAFMTGIAQRLAAHGYTLRSGGADGADTAFETGAGELKEIWLPYKGFNESTSRFILNKGPAFEIASTIHPVWHHLGYGAKLLHARNCHQVLGADLRTPSKFLICWTKGGGQYGGTATAIKLAMRWQIPVFNLYQGGDRPDAPIEDFAQGLLNVVGCIEKSTVS